MNLKTEIEKILINTDITMASKGIRIIATIIVIFFVLKGLGALTEKRYFRAEIIQTQQQFIHKDKETMMAVVLACQGNKADPSVMQKCADDTRDTAIKGFEKKIRNSNIRLAFLFLLALGVMGGYFALAQKQKQLRTRLLNSQNSDQYENL